MCLLYDFSFQRNVFGLTAASKHKITLSVSESQTDARDKLGAGLLPAGTSMGPIVSLVASDRGAWTLSFLVVLEKDSPFLQDPGIKYSFGPRGGESDCNYSPEKVCPVSHRVEEFGRARLYYQLEVPLDKECPTALKYIVPDGRSFKVQLPRAGAPPKIAYGSCSGHWESQILNFLCGPFNFLPICRLLLFRLRQNAHSSRNLASSVLIPSKFQCFGSLHPLS